MFKCTIRAFIIILILVRYYECLRVQEGELAQLDFLYPCISTEVTLQRSNGAPFYSSENSNPDVILQSNKNVTNRKGNDTCSLQLTINPVSRHDEGTYIPIAYENGGMINPTEERRIWLGVDYPPGKASCELPTDGIQGEWVRMQCTASKGTLPGQIVCYQNGKSLPQLTSPPDTATTVDQTILARIADPVYCCSSNLTKTKDVCECKDWGWDPLNGLLLINIDPCAAASTTHALISSKDLGVDNTTPIPTSIPLLTTDLINPTLYQKDDFKVQFVFAMIFFGLALITICILKVEYLKRKIQNFLQSIGKQKARDTQLSVHEQVPVKEQDDTSYM